MNRSDYDLILVGGGLANSLIAWRLKTERPELNLLILEQGEQLGGNHTWSFHDGDLTPEQHTWLAPLVSHRWPHYRVVFPHRERQLMSGYNCIRSDVFAQQLTPSLGASLRTRTTVVEVQPSEVTLADGQVLTAKAVIDGRGPATSAHMALGFQTFLGQEIRTVKPHGLAAPIIMDARVQQGDGYRFVYVLPFAPDRLLIEDTHYVDAHHAQLDADRLRNNIREYATNQDWQIDAILHEEQGALPITLAGNWQAFWQDAGDQPLAGLRAGLFHPTTGYSLPHAVRLAQHIATLPDLGAATLCAAIRAHSQREWRSQGFFRLLNRMLFLAGRPSDRWQVMQRFYGLSDALIERFYAQRLTLADKLRIVSGKPPVPVAQAVRAALQTDPQHIRNNK